MIDNNTTTVIRLEAVEQRDSTGTRLNTLYRVWSNKDFTSTAIIETTDFRYAMQCFINRVQ